MKKTLLVIFAAAMVFAGCKQKTTEVQAPPQVQDSQEATVYLTRATATSKWASAACPNTAPPTKSIHTDCFEKTSHNNE